MQKVWLNSYPKSVHQELPPFNKNFLEEFEEACQNYHNKPAFISFGKELSYKELHEKALHFAGFLQAQGFKKGESFVIQLPNILQYPVFLWGVLIAGLKVVNMNPLCKPREMLHVLKDTSARGIVLLSNKLKDIKQIKDESSLELILFTGPGDFLNPPKKQLVNFIFKLKTKSFLPVSMKEKVSALSALKQKIKAQPVKTSLDDVLFIQYTGGTTGVIKGVCLTQKNILSNIKQCELWVLNYLKKGEEKALAALPFFHVFALVVNGLLFFFNGFTNILIANPRHLPSLIKTLKKQRITIGTGVNTLFKNLLLQKKFHALDFSSWKFFVSGAMPLESSVKKSWQDVTQSRLIEGYGLTECSPVVSVGRLDIEEEGFAGYPLPSTDIRITNEKGEELGLDQEGELEVKGPQVMQGYYKKDQETQMVLDHAGWLKTGDIAKVTQKGAIQILDRKKDLIIISGFNVYPSEVEHVLNSHPQVKESAVIAGKNEKKLEEVKAFVVKKELELTEKKLIEYCKSNLSSYKVPKTFVFCEDIPKSLVGKPLRRLMKG